MKKGSFPERSAHLSYVAPLIAVLFWLQLGEGTTPGSLVLIAGLLGGGLFSAFTGARWSRRERGRTSRAALLGAVLNVASLVFLVFSVLDAPPG